VTYDKTVQFLYGLQIFGANFGLENTFRLVARVGNPQEQLRFIHVAGTNGKGSTCAMLESIYRAAGLRVGLFTSPHLVSFRERIQVNRQLIPEAEVIRLVEALRAANKENDATLFEFATVMALKFFAEQKCDLVIWETGLGGRLDATNIVTPLVSVITNIGFDHQQWLGDTLARIAAEKAGIIKPGVPVITATAAPEALVVIEKIAHEKNVPLKLVIVDDVQSRLTGTLAPPLLGEHQKLNAALALATVEMLQRQISVSAEKICAGLAAVDWPGRLQLVTRTGGQKILLDGAHNADGAKALRAALEKHFSQLCPVFIFGALADKNWLDICRTLAPLAARIFTVPVASARTADARELAAAFHSANPAAEVMVVANFSEALNASKDEPFVVVTGSLYLVGEALERLGLAPGGTGERGLNEWNATPIQR
jgi:dihydrofolate synthase/folylpolyglutamate synthase